MDSHDLATLDPHVRELATKLLEQSAQAGIPLTVIFTRRSLETQDALYAQGRTTPGSIVTNARAGYSFHNFGLAFDVVPTELLSLPNWGDTPAQQAHTNVLWATVGKLGMALGLTWGGDFKSIEDRPHFEWSGGLTLAELRAGRSLTDPPAPNASATSYQV